MPAKQLAECDGSLERMTLSSDSDWWDVVKVMAEYVAVGYDESDLTAPEVRQELIEQGFQEAAIAQAVLWVEKALLSGRLTESLAMLQGCDITLAARFSNPLERIAIPERLWSQLYNCRQKGLLSHEVFERLIEGIRAVDVRDWDEFDIRQLLEELLHSLLPHLNVQQCRLILLGEYPTLLS